MCCSNTRPTTTSPPTPGVDLQ
uniref:Uncharacterized protein n=1 Tax=Arundo donax TaxID=35708 RepID=A0A0A9AK70_ARUDO